LNKKSVLNLKEKLKLKLFFVVGLGTTLIRIYYFLYSRANMEIYTALFSVGGTLILSYRRLRRHNSTKLTICFCFICFMLLLIFYKFACNVWELSEERIKDQYTMIADSHYLIKQCRYETGIFRYWIQFQFGFLKGKPYIPQELWKIYFEIRCCGNWICQKAGTVRIRCDECYFC